MILELLRTQAIDTPWPIVFDDSSSVSGRLGLNDICRTKCVDRPCKSSRGSLIGTRCHLGLTVYESRVDNEVVRVFGVVGPQHRDALPTHVDFKKACKGRTVTAQDFAEWISKIRLLAESIKNRQDEKMAQALEPLHDVMRTAKDVALLAEQLLAESTPDVADKFSAASSTQRALVKTASLLVDTFDLLEIYLNPLAAGFGQRRSIEVYKLIDKLSKIASIARRQEQRALVHLIGSTRRSYDLFDSFKLIPLTLIDNAQKYSRQGTNVKVEVVEIGSSLVVTVISEGALLSADEQKRIFERGFRGFAARAVHPTGMGLGLYIAQTVARANGTHISVNSVPLQFQIARIAQGTNSFSFTLHGGVP
jgi:signal transduction histidine kinase